MKEVLLAITKARAGAAIIINETGELCGIFTDGDLRRLIEKGINIVDEPVKDVMTKNPICISQDQLATEALRILKEHKIDEIPVVDEKNKPIGMIDVQDLLDVGMV